MSRDAWRYPYVMSATLTHCTAHKDLHNGLGSSKNRPGKKGSETECKGVIHNDDWVPVDRGRGSWVVRVCSLPSHDQQGTVADCAFE
jgi:hypothetical protein